MALLSWPRTALAMRKLATVTAKKYGIVLALTSAPATATEIMEPRTTPQTNRKRMLDPVELAKHCQGLYLIASGGSSTSRKAEQKRRDDRPAS